MRQFLRYLFIACTVLLSASQPVQAHEYPDTVRVNIGQSINFFVRDAADCSATVWIDRVDDPSVATFTPMSGDGIEVEFIVQAYEDAGVTTIVIQWTGEHVGMDEGHCTEDTRESGGREIVIRVTPDDVNTADDGSDFIPGDGHCDTGGNVSRGVREEPKCTLRAAIEEANAGGRSNITFDVADPGPTPHVLVVTKLLPSMDVPMSITGPGSAGKTAASRPEFMIRASGAIMNGLVVSESGAGSQIEGLLITDFLNGIVIETSSVTVTRCELTNNSSSGILIDGGRENTIGGQSEADRNYLYTNARFGIEIIDGSQNMVLGNWIGMESTGQSPSGNLRGGIRVSGGDHNAVGGISETPGDAPGNWFVANGPDGAIMIEGDDNIVRGNLIGAIDDIPPAAGNHGPGVSIEGSGNTIGGSDAEDGNTIVFNDSTGVVVTAIQSERNTIRRNLIFENKGIPIDLGADGPTPNDPGTGIGDEDDDSGPNRLMNYPVALMLQIDPFDGAGLIISGVVDAPNPNQLIIEIYSSEKEGPVKKGNTRFGVSQVFVDTTRASSKGVIRKHITAAQVPHLLLSATATDLDGNTSEVSWICLDTDNNNSVDFDKDGVCDDWETGGIDYDGDGTVDLTLSTFGPRLDRRDIFVEVDWMAGYEPVAGALDDVKAAFLAAPKPIGLHVFKDEQVPLIDPLRFGSRPVAGEAGTLRDIRYGKPEKPCGSGATDGHFGPAADRAADNCGARLGARRLVFRYNLFAARYASAPRSSGVATLFGNNFLVTVGTWSDNSIRSNSGLGAGAPIAAAKRIIQASTFMHELGHTLGMRHGGFSDDNCKPNYASIMSYSLQFPSLIPGRVMDYSRERLPNLNETALSETSGLRGAANRQSLFQSGASTYFIPTTLRTVDWDDDRTLEASVRVDVNNLRDWCQGAGLDSTLTGHDDWSLMDSNFRLFDSFASQGATDPPSVLEPTEEEVLEAAQTADYDRDAFSNADDNCPSIANPEQEDEDNDGIGDACEGDFADMSLRLDGSDPGAESVTYTLTAINHGPNEATDIVIVDTLGFWLSPGAVSASSGSCSTVNQVISCALASLAVGDSVVVRIDATASTPGLTGNLASVTSTFDPNPYNDVWEFIGATAVRVEPPAGQDLPPASFQLFSPYPNPFYRHAKINFDLVEPGHVRMSVFDVAGRLVVVLADGMMQPGRHEAVFEGESFPAGIYLVRLEASGQVASTNLVLIR
ncbi:MAG: putative repeat protein (TIGR01451 family) [Rhodothermales bacterium]|jgi:uncharacterized repeat protein (TIGR01451 family)